MADRSPTCKHITVLAEADQRPLSVRRALYDMALYQRLSVSISSINIPIRRATLFLS